MATKKQERATDIVVRLKQMYPKAKCSLDFTNAFELLIATMLSAQSTDVRVNKKLFHVGRLDADTEGLMLLTNDGELAHRLMHPSFEVPKTYLATVVGTVPRGIGRKLRDGIELEDGPAGWTTSRWWMPCPARRWCE